MADALPPMVRLVELMFDACRAGRTDMIPALLQAGVDIEVADARGHTPLVIASYNGQADATALLLGHGARPDGAEGFDGNSALMGVAFKGHDAIAGILLAAGAVPDRRNGAGQTALMMAAMVGRDAIVERLLAAGADPAATDVQGNTPASLARAQGNVAMAGRLERAASVMPSYP